MTHIDPRDQRRFDDPLMPEARRLDPDPVNPVAGPRFDRAPGNSWAVIGGLAAALVVVLVAMSMFGSPGDPAVRTPAAQTPPVQQSAPAPGTQPMAPDTTTTGSVPRPQPNPQP